MSIKKRICNWPAAIVAAHGDPEIEGYLRGAIEAVKVMPEPIKEWYERREVKIAEAYLADRQAAVRKCLQAYAALNSALLDKIDE